jgi:hypothetical protein
VLFRSGADGKVEIDIPGFGKFEAANADDLKANLETAGAMTALKEYQSNAGKSSEQLAKEQLSVTETQAIAVSQIRDAILLGLKEQDRTDILTGTKIGVGTAQGTGIVAATDLSEAVIENAKVANTAIKTASDQMVEMIGDSQNPQTLNQTLDRMKIKTEDGKITEPTDKIQRASDLFLSEGSAPQLFSEGTLYKGIVGDEVAIGTGLSEAFNKTGKLTELMASIPSKNNGSGENTSVNGKIDININLGGSVSGDNGNVEKMFSDPKFQKQMMDMVLYKMDKYKQQQGTLS